MKSIKLASVLPTGLKSQKMKFKMKIENPIEYLKKYIADHIDDDDGNWESRHQPHLKNILGSLTEVQALELSEAIWNWPHQLLYELAEPISDCENQYLNVDFIHCKLFSRTSDLMSLDFLTQNLSAAFHLLTDEERDPDMLKSMRTNLLTVLESEVDDYWINNYKDLIAAIEQHLH